MPVDASDERVKIFLSGDVMTGRGLDQALPNPVDPQIYEPYIKDARDYLLLAKRKSGAFDTPLSYDYIWGDAFEIFENQKPDLKIINLETAVTNHDEPYPGKGINYRMSPENFKAITSAEIDLCILANNHTLDWQQKGLLETLKTIDEAGVEQAGAGKNLDAAEKPVIIEQNNTRILIFSYGSPDSGIPADWEAENNKPGLNMIFRYNDETLKNIKQNIDAYKKPGDIIVFSIHWGGNWGYDVPERHRDFAHKLIEEAGADLIHGHSSHHPKGIEVYQDKLIIYGAGDLINDYEGIGGHEQYRPELSLMYFPVLNTKSGDLEKLIMIPTKMHEFKLNRAFGEDAQWLKDILKRESEEFGTTVKMSEEGEIIIE